MKAIIVTKKFYLQSSKEIVLSKFPREAIEIPSSDKDDLYENANNGPKYRDEILNTLLAGSTLSDHLLTFKIPFPVIILRNIDLGRRHISSTRYIVKETHLNPLFLKWFAEKSIGKLFILP